MAPNPRVIRAFRAMKALGISENKVKPVLKKLLKLYDKNWELIEEENYRTLLDAIFDDDGPEQDDNFEETRGHDEPERLLKRLQPDLRNQVQKVVPPASDSNTALNALMLKVPKEEHGELSDHGTNSLQPLPDKRKSQPTSISPRGHVGSTGKQPANADSPSPRMRHSYKGKAPIMLPEVSAKGKTPLDCTSHALQIRDAEADTEKSLLTKRKAPDNHPLIKPKDEPLTDYMPLDNTPFIEAPIAMIVPDSSAWTATNSKPNGQKPPAVISVAGGKGVGNLSNGMRNNGAIEPFPEEFSNSLEIATSLSGEVKISIRCNSNSGKPSFHMPSRDKLLQSMQEKCLRSYKILDPNFSVQKLMQDMCECFLELATDSSHESQEEVTNVACPLDTLKKSAARHSLYGNSMKEHNFVPGSTLNGSVRIPRLLQPINGTEDMLSNNGDTDIEQESRALVVVPQSRLSSNELRYLHNLNDLTKGEENIEIPWINEINNEFPPSFSYIPKCLVFQNAQVKFRLCQIKPDNSCPNCIVDCLSPSAPCICSGESGNQFAYTLEGLVKDEFLEDSISMTRDPQRQCLSFCINDCALERSKNDELLEPCKGHLKRKCIKECWSKCGCHNQCGNRVVQRGMQYRLQVFHTDGGKGWGLRTLERLPKGAFICEYAGEILTMKEWYERKARRKNSANAEHHVHPVVLDAYWSSKGDLKDDEALCLDAAFYGNIARLINHRCLDANLIEIPVKLETPEHHYYHLAFFTTREVDAMEELTWDYGIDFNDNDHPNEAFHCQCGSKFCRNMKRLNRSKSKLR